MPYSVALQPPPNDTSLASVIGRQVAAGATLPTPLTREDLTQENADLKQEVAGLKQRLGAPVEEGVPDGDGS